MRQMSNTLNRLFAAVLRRIGVAFGGAVLPGQGASPPAAGASDKAPARNAGGGLQEPARDVFVRNPSYAQDGLYTLHCADFMRDEHFAKAYAAGEATGSWSGAAVHWRVYVACWFAERASSLEGDLIECGVNRGGISRAIVSYMGEKLQQ